MLSLRDLRFAYPGGPTVFDGFSAEIGPGVTWIVGDEGSGKTTLLKLIQGALRDRGQVVIDSSAQDVAWLAMADEALDAVGVGALFDRLRASAPGFDDSVLERHVDGFALRPHLGKSMAQLSTGTRRKVGLAAVFAMRSPVTLLDDPGAALDGSSVAHLMRSLGEADREAARACLVTAYAAPRGVAPDRVITLPHSR